MSWLSAHPMQVFLGVLFIGGIVTYAALRPRLGFLMRALVGLVVLGIGGIFGWSMLSTFDVTSLGPAVGGVLAVMFIFALIDDADGGGWRGRQGRSGSDVNRFL